MAHTPGLMSAGTVACLVFLLATPATASNCVVGCRGLNPGKAYEPGHTYTYSLEGKSVSRVSEAQGDSKLNLNGVVELSVKPDCVHQLKLKNVQVNGAPVALQDLEKYALQFNYHDGHIDTNVCAEKGDSQASLNLKRAVVSLFQSMINEDTDATSHRETDVFGGCQTDFAFSKSGNKLTVQKQRDLSRCAHRETIKQGLITAAFDPTARIQSSPLLSSNQRIEQRFDSGFLEEATSVENYVLKPFSNGDSSASTRVETRLKFKGKKADPSPPAPVSQPKSLVFDPPHPIIGSSTTGIVNALRAVKEEVPESGVKPDAASKFADLVKVLGVSSKKDILTAYHQVSSGAGFDKVTDKRILLDALFRAGTGEAAEVVVELIRKREVTGLESLAYYASLALIRHVHLPTVKAITSLLNEQQDLPRISYLGIGHIIGKYCEEHECEGVPEVKEALAKIASKVGNGKYKNRQQENVAVAALKALGNAKYHDDTTTEKILTLATDKKAQTRVRVAAIEALPSSCSPKWKKGLFEVFGNMEEDSEIRIKSYLSLVQCVDSQVAAKIKEVLDKEKINQVGSFVTSHLRNLRASTDPTKQYAKAHLEGIRPRDKFPEDMRKFSFNNELSYNVDAFGLGSTAESNVIYSQNSFVPRSASLNLTTEVFGHSFNLLELDGRVENLDRLLEHYFGPKGEIRTKELQDLVRSGRASADSLLKHLKERLEKSSRGRREIKHESLNKFAKKVHLSKEAIDGDLDVDVSLKMFGVELAYLDYRAAGVGANPEELIDKICDLLDKGITRAKDFDQRIERHMNFLDVDLVYPTGLGLPLSLGVKGTGVVRIKASGKIDIPSIIKDPKNAALRIALEPSASITIVGTFGLDGFGFESGLRHVSTLHTSTGSDVSVKLLEGRGIDLNFGIPKRKQEVVSVTSEILMATGKKGDKYVAPNFSKGKEHSDCFDQLSSVLGVTVCGHLSYPYDSLESVHKKPFFPLSGPAKFSLSLENNDVTSYHFKAYLDDTQPGAGSLEVFLETPNSKTPRKLAFKAEGALAPHDKYFRVALDSPLKTLSLEAHVKDDQAERVITLTAVNDVDQYYLRAGVAVSGKTYKPVLEYKVPEHIEKLAHSKTGATKTAGSSQQLYRVEGDIAVSDTPEGGHKYSFKKLAFVASGKTLASIEGSVLSDPKRLALDTKISRQEDENVVVKMDAACLDRQVKFSGSVLPSTDPNLALKLDYDLKWKNDKTKGGFDNHLVFVHGPEAQSQVNRLELVNKLNYEIPEKPVLPSEPRIPAFKSENKLTWPAQELSSEVNVELANNKVHTEADLRYGKFKAGAEFKLEREPDKKFELEVKASAMNSKIGVEVKRNRIDDTTNKFEVEVELPGSKYEGEATLSYDVKKDSLAFVKFNGDAKLDKKRVKMEFALNATPQKVNSHGSFAVGGSKVSEFKVDLQRGPMTHGELMVSVKNILNLEGDFKQLQSKANAKLTIDLPSVKRKIKATGDINGLATGHIIGNVEVLYDAERDPSRKIAFSTNTNTKNDIVDSKNTLEVLTYKTEVNVNGKIVDNGKNGNKLDGTVDITLPNDHCLTLKASHSLNRDDSKKNHLKGTYELSHAVQKGGDTENLRYETDMAWKDDSEYDFNGKHTVVVKGFDGKNIKLTANGAHQPQQGSDKKKTELDVELEGSYLSKPFKLGAVVNCDQKDGDWDVHSSFGDNLGVKGHGSYSRGNHVDKPLTSETQLDFKFPSDKLSSLQYKTSQSLLTPLEVDGTLDYTGSSSITYNGDKSIKAGVKARNSGVPDWDHKSEGSLVLTLEILKNPQMKISSTYSHDPSADKKKSGGTLDLDYGDKKVTIASELGYTEDLNDVTFDLKATSPVQKYRNVELKVHKKIDRDAKHHYDLVLVADDQKYTLNSELLITPVTNSVSVLLTCPNGKTEIVSKINYLGDGAYTGEWKVDSPMGFVNADLDIKLDSFDAFLVKFKFDCDKFKYRLIKAEIAAKPPAKSGKRLTVSVTSDGKNIVTGSTNYNKRVEPSGKVVVEGQGNLKIGENSRSSKFTYTRQQLTQGTDGEVGVFIALNANFGPSAIIGEIKFTNQEIRVFNSYCEMNKDCANFKIQSAFRTEKDNQVKHDLTVEMNLKKFNVPVEFGLITATKYQIKELLLDHTANLYVHAAKDRAEYFSKVYIHPKDSAIILTLPSRELAIISTLKLPQKSKSTGAYNVDISVYLDRKNHPKVKTSFVASGDFNVQGNALTAAGDAKFTYPQQSKPMLVKGRLSYGQNHLLDAHLDLDVFRTADQKIVIQGKLEKSALPNGNNFISELTIKSRGQQLDVALKENLALSTTEFGFGSTFSYNDQHQKPKSMGVTFSINAAEAHFLLQAPNQNLIKSDTTLQLEKHRQAYQTEYTILDGKTMRVEFEAKDMNSFKYEHGVKNDPKNKVTAEGKVILGQVAEIRADVVKNGEKKILFKALVHLDDKQYLKPDVDFNKDNINEFIERLRTRNIDMAKAFKEVAYQMGQEAKTEFKDLAQHLKKAQPNFKPLIEYYDAELTKLKSELHADETIKKIQDTLNKTFGGLITAVTQTLKQVSEQLVELNKQFHEIVEKFGEAVKATYPQLKESFDKICQAVAEIVDAAVKLGSTYAKAIIKIVNDHKKELKELLTVGAELAQDIAKIIHRGYAQIEKDVKEFVVQVIEQLKSLPIYEMLKEKYQELAKFQIPEEILASVEQVFEHLNKLLPTDELQKLFSTVYNYVMKHVRREKVNDSTEIQKIYTQVVEAIQSIIAMLQNRTFSDKFFTFSIGGLPIDLSFVKSLPGVSTLRLSALNLIKNRELPSPADFYFAYRPTRHPTDLIPPFSKTGFFFDGGHFFTYDGRHLTLPGTCDYIVAQDMRDGNFSVVATLASGKLSAVTVTAPSESISIKSNGKIVVNGKESDYPASTKNLHAFLTLPSVNIKSDYGLRLSCTPKAPMLCTLRVSGFYQGKVRGILGDGNNEPYDDFTLPSNHITKDEAVFGNSYKLNSGCADAPAVDHKHHTRNPTCTEYFTGSSSLSPCFAYIDPAGYRQACDHATAGTPQAACLVASVYWAACREKRVAIAIPNACGKCSLKGSTVNVGDEFSVKVPKDQADVIFVVEQNLKNQKVFEELVQPLITEVKNELKHHGITDVHVGLIGFGEHMKWPQHYTTGGSTNVKPDIKNMNFAESEELLTLEDAKKGDAAERLKYLKQRLNVELGTFALTDAYEEAINYPFRPGAAKAVIGVIASPCEKSPLLVSLQQLRLLLGRHVYQDRGLTYYHIAFLDDLQVGGKTSKNVVGYDVHSVYTLAHHKKKPLEGDADMRSNLVLTNNDVCAAFAVSSGGAAFSANNFLDAKPNQKKPFIQVTSRRIAENLVNTQLGVDCKCELQRGIDAQANCKIVSRKEKEPLARHTKGSIKG